MATTSVNSTPAVQCFHCGLPVQSPKQYIAVVNRAPVACCCVGCQAIVETIYGSGLGAFYERRTPLNENSGADSRAALATDSAATNYTHFDHEAVLADFATRIKDNVWEASFVIEGVTCAACVWLFDQKVSATAGVLHLDVNYAMRKALIRWDQSVVKISDILAAVRKVGLGAWPSEDPKTTQIAARERRTALLRLFVAAFGMMQVMMYAYPAYVAGEGELSADQAQLMRIAGLVLTVPVVLFSALPFFRGAWRDLKAQLVSMDTPIAIGVAAAFVGSVWATMVSKGAVYFDSITMFVFLVLCARHLEYVSRERASGRLTRLKRSVPEIAQRYVDFQSTRDLEKVPALSVKKDDVLLVAAGDSFPTDARIVEGVSTVDEALLTGESKLIEKQPGEEVIGGSINVAQPVSVRVTHGVREGRLASVVRLVERAQSQRPQVAQLADRVARLFVWVVLALAACAYVFWMNADADKALAIAIAVLVVSCPCALSLATPAAIAATTAALARRGFILTRASAIERLGGATHVVFDKTGTLTEGRVRVVDIRTMADVTRSRCEQIAAALERGIRHPIAEAFSSIKAPLDAKAVSVAHGFGVEGDVEDRKYRLGSRDWVLRGLASMNTTVLETQSPHTEVLLADDSRVLAVFTLGDRIRADAAELITALKARGCEVILATGDQVGPAMDVAEQVGIASVKSALTPEAKLELVKMLQAQGARVAMVGDGINDAPVLGEAFVSVAMGSGALLAQATADIVMLSPKLCTLLEGLRAAAKTRSVIRQNLIWAFAYNITLIPLAALGLVTPWASGIGMAASSALVVLNAMRLHHVVNSHAPVTHPPKHVETKTTVEAVVTSV